MPIPEQNGTTSSDTLNGWKDIASYLNRSVRAVQRWERELGLPVHRIKAMDGQTVYGLRAEIDEWRRSRDLPKTLPEDAEDATDVEALAALQNATGPDVIPTRSTTAASGPWRWVGVTLLAFLLVGIGAAIGVFVIARRAGPMDSIHVAGTGVTAYDALGRVAWTSGFGRQISLALGAISPGIGGTLVDLDQDGQSEAIVAVRFSTGGTPSPESDALVAFDAHGNILWKLQPDRRFQCGSDVFEGPWRIYSVRASTGPGPQRTWVAFNHSTWWPGFVMEVDAKGQSQLRMLNTGWIYDLAEWRTPNGTFLAVAGVNNERVRPSLAVLDLGAQPAMPPHSESRFSCEGAPEAMPQRAYLFPVLDTGLPAGAFVRQITVLASTLKVQIRSGGGNGIAEIGADLRVRDFSLSDDYWAAHRQRETEGLLDHPAESCPERTRPQPIEEWAAATGWLSSSIIPTVRQSSPKK